jgi:hypothetical protein
MVTQIWHGATVASKNDEYLNLNASRRHTRLPLDPRQQGSLRAAPHGGRDRTFLDGHVLGVEEAIRALPGDDISVAKYYDFDKDFLLELERTPRTTRCTTGKPSA